jgi:AraC-like DNA-binding protein
MNTAVGSLGHFVAWDGGAVFLGRHGGVVPPHAHYAIQVCFGSTPNGVALRTGEDDAWTTFEGGGIVPSRQPHSMDVRMTPYSAVLFVEPETREGRALTELHLHDGIAAIPEATLAGPRDALFSAWLDQRDAHAITAACWGVIGALTGGVAPSVASDPRILRAIAYVKAHLADSPTLEQVAAEACLSPSRFRHLFVEETGMALRPYILWRRLLHVWELLMVGESLSTAAHLAGFADAAHLTRTSKRMLGMPPSLLQMAGPLRPGEHAGWRALSAPSERAAPTGG